MKTLLLLAALLSASTATAVQPLTLDDAQALAAARNPELATAEARRDAADAAADQAGAWPNPRLFLELENAPRDGDLWNDAERITGLEWSLPWRGVRGATAAAARADAEAATAGRDAAARELASRVHAAFADVLHARALVDLRAQAHEGWLETMRMTEQREVAGDAAPTQTLRARVAAAAAQTEAEAAAADLTTAVGTLAALLDVTEEQAAAAEGELGALLSPRTSGAVHPSLRAADAAARADAQRAHAAARGRLPELELGFGVRRPGGGGEHALDLGLAVELPLFDRRGAASARARAEARAGEARLRTARLDLARRHSAAVVDLARAEAQFKLVNGDLLPAARELERTATAAHAAGDIDMSELIQVRREAMGLRESALRAARDLERARARAAWLGGGSF